MPISPPFAFPEPVLSARPVLRFAPSPNGELHLGHAYSALRTWQIASQLNGIVLLRIEDIDTARTREIYVDQIFEDLHWLGLGWPEPVRRQSEHFDIYRSAADALLRRGLLYPCTATRKQIAQTVADRPDWPTDPDGVPLYPGLCKKVHTSPEGGAAAILDGHTALRLDMTRAMTSIDDPTALAFRQFEPYRPSKKNLVTPEEWGDAVLVRKDTPTSYHLSVVVDDAIQGITHITRGQDLEASTSLHVLLQALLGLPTADYNHHPLIADSAGRKLAKRLGDTSLRSLRESGWSIGDVRRAVGLEIERD